MTAGAHLAGSAKYMVQVLPVLLDASKNRDPNLRQCAVYGLGVLAEYRSEGFRQIAATAIQTLLAVINEPEARHGPMKGSRIINDWRLDSSVLSLAVDTQLVLRKLGARAAHPPSALSSMLLCGSLWSNTHLDGAPSSHHAAFYCLGSLVGACCRSEDNATATENAVAALGRVLEFQSDVVDGQQGKSLANTWVQALPILEDSVEAVKVHAQLIRFLEKSDAR